MLMEIKLGSPAFACARARAVGSTAREHVIHDACPGERPSPTETNAAPPLRDRKFADSLLEGRVTSELVSESEARKNQIFRGFG